MVDETKPATNDATEAARAQLALDNEAREKTAAEYAERMKGKPTPTQEENDLAVLGAHITEKEHDGSMPDPGHRPARGGPGGMHNPEEARARLAAEASKREAAAKSESEKADYATRQSRAATPPATRRTE